MQLFITDYTKNNSRLIINDAELLSQLRKVLRATIGDIVWVQSPVHETKNVRYEVRIEKWDNKMIEGSIVSELSHKEDQKKSIMLVAMPNKWDKAELIVQKLTECGLDQIIFWPSERSVIKERNSKKEERLAKIIKEAVEQSRGWKLPEVVFTNDVTKYIEDAEVIVFDRKPTPPQPSPLHGEGAVKNIPLSTEWRGVRGEVTTITGVVGPEGGLTEKDYKMFESYAPKIVGLGETVLRMETAAIVGGRLIRNDK